ncbi:MAG: hypothetical protein CL678_07260 [Bdellovibrionaceae bacterium]|nr:hypothetical protein [Pseudobdellovibrionaceae bacterium]
MRFFFTGYIFLLSFSGLAKAAEAIVSIQKHTQHHQWAGESYFHRQITFENTLGPEKDGKKIHQIHFHELYQDRELRSEVGYFFVPGSIANFESFFILKEKSLPALLLRSGAQVFGISPLTRPSSHPCSSQMVCPELKFWGMKEYVEDIHFLIQQIKMNHPRMKKIIFVGYSLGAMVGEVYASHFPKSIDGMVLIDGTLVSKDPRFIRTMEGLCQQGQKMSDQMGQVPEKQVYLTMIPISKDMTNDQKKKVANILTHPLPSFLWPFIYLSPDNKKTFLHSKWEPLIEYFEIGNPMTAGKLFLDYSCKDRIAELTKNVAQFEAPLLSIESSGGFNGLMSDFVNQTNSKSLATESLLNNVGHFDLLFGEKVQNTLALMIHAWEKSTP